MKNDIIINEFITIPEDELTIIASKAGGPGGQHVNKTNSRITIRWNIKNTIVLTDEQKERVVQKLQTQLTHEGDLIIHNSASRSLEQNKKAALLRLAQEIRIALYVAKKRKPTRISHTVKKARLQAKSHRSTTKKMRNKKINHD